MAFKRITSQRRPFGVECCSREGYVQRILKVLSCGVVDVCGAQLYPPVGFRRRSPTSPLRPHNFKVVDGEMTQSKDMICIYRGAKRNSEVKTERGTAGKRQQLKDIERTNERRKKSVIMRF